ncbi:MAG: tRNA lysidine(34) synthetase TilS [Opitutaceae bacterium]|nr:tRNA lysidine(34) synthetase TilS [Opitutaceae bacterium]
MTRRARRPAFTELAARLAAEFPRARLDPTVVAWADQAPARVRWGVAFSGGADSLALLLLVWAHWPGRRRRLRVLHFDHRLRGKAAQADARFCRAVCRALGVEFVAGAWRDARSDASEAEARAARLAFLARHARVLWFGHQQDDIAESLLMRLARGSGTGGLAAPRPVQRLPRERVHLRPLLTLKKAELVAALRAAGAAWCEDASNAGDRYFRNRIRRSVVPPWQAAAQRDALAGAARSRMLLEEDDTALEAWLASLNVFGARGALQLRRLAGKPRALWRRALHRWLAQEPRAGEISRVAFETLLAALESGRRTRHSLGRQGFAVLDGRALRFEPAGKARRKFHGPAN